MVGIKGEGPLDKPVTLHQFKATPGKENCLLVRISRLSVHPITKDEWDIYHRDRERRLKAARKGIRVVIDA